MRFRGGKVRLFSCGLFAASALLSAPSLAEVKREGTWPATDPKVSLDVSRAPREEAIRKLADAAGWSVVVHAPSTDPVDVHVKDQPAGKVLDLLLLDSEYIATRDGTLVSIRRAKEIPPPAAKPGVSLPKPVKPSNPEEPGAAPEPPEPLEPADVPEPPEPPEIPVVVVPPLPAEIPVPPPPPGIPSVAVPPVPPLPPLPPMAGSAAQPSASASAKASAQDMPKEKGADVAITGDDYKIAKKQVVHNVSVVGGDIEVYGVVTGGVRAVGGDVHIHSGARIFGGVSSMGGDVRVEDFGRIDGPVNVAGGVLRRSEKAILGGPVKGEVKSVSSGKGDDDDDDDDAVAVGKSGRAFAESKAAEVGSSFARMALLFVFGTVLLALQTERMDQLKAELVARPMRSFAMGVLGAIGAGAMFLVLCVTVIGIPFALLGALALFLALAASVCAVLETIGRALVRHRSQNPYVHLGLGCALFLAATALPFIGPIVGVVVVMLALGVLVSTRGAGLLQKSLRGAQPYRAAVV